MKKVLLAILVVISSITGLAQKNVIKLNLPSIAMGGAVLQYERDLIPMINVQVGVGVYGRSDVNSFGMFAALNDIGVQAGGYAFQGEIRIYPNILKEGPKGFYIAPYGKMGHYNLGFNPSYETTFTLADESQITSTMDVTFDGSMDYTSFGVQFGHQWLILGKVAINLYMFGPGVSFYNYQMTGGVSMTADIDPVLIETELENAVKAQVEGIPFVGKKLSDGIDFELDTSVSGDPSFATSGVLNYIPRMRMGLSVGIAL